MKMITQIFTYILYYYYIVFTTMNEHTGEKTSSVLILGITTVNKFPSGFSLSPLSYMYIHPFLLSYLLIFFLTLVFITWNGPVIHNHFEYMSGLLMVVIRVRSSFNYRNRAATANSPTEFSWIDRSHTRYHLYRCRFTRNDITSTNAIRVSIKKY